MEDWNARGAALQEEARKLIVPGRPLDCAAKHVIEGLGESFVMYLLTRALAKVGDWNAAQDAAQEAMWGLFQKLIKERCSIANFVGCAHSILRNKIADQRDHRGGRVGPARPHQMAQPIDGETKRQVAEIATSAPQPLDVLAKQENGAIVHAALAEMEDDFDRDIVLCRMHYESLRKTAEVMNVGVGKVRSASDRFAAILERKTVDGPGRR